MTDKKHVFISYSRENYDFVKHLRTALDANTVKYWIDQNDLRAGTANWEQALRDAIKEAYAVIYVGSEKARASDYVRDELAIASLYKVNIIPVWADGKDWIECVPIGYGGRQYLDLRHDEFEHNFNKLLIEIKKKTPDITVMPSTSTVLHADMKRRNPYKGLNAFTEKDVADYFGRDELITQLLESVKERITAGQDSILTVIGASGSGKSSVVMAGLLPKLKAGALSGSDQWTYLKPMVPGDHPVQALNRLLLDTPELDVDIDRIEKDLQHGSGIGLYRLARKIPKQPVVLYIDQFEELFLTGVPEEERQQFISLLTYAVTQPDSSILALLTLRADFYDRPMSDLVLGRLVQSYNRSVLPMSIADLRDTVEKPAAAAGLSFEAGLIADIIFDLRDDKSALAGALPLLQYTLEQLYERRTENTLTAAAYREIGGVKGAIGTHAENVFLSLDAEAQSTFAHVFQSLVHIDERGMPTRKRETEVVLINQPVTARLVDALIRHARVLRIYTEKLGDTPYVEVAHEALLISWKRLAEWIRGSESDLRLIQEMKAATARWVSEGYPKHRLWSHELLQPVYKALENLPLDLTDNERVFIQPEAERLLEDFKHAPQHVQLTIIERDFARIGEQSLPLLVQTYEYSNDALKEAMIRILWQYPQATFSAVQRIITNQDAKIRLGAIKLIGRLRLHKLNTALLNALEDNHSQIRSATAEALGEIGHATVVPNLLIALNDNDWQVRSATASVLGRFLDNQVVAALIRVLDDNVYDVRQAALAALKTLDIKASANTSFPHLVDGFNPFWWVNKVSFSEMTYVPDTDSISNLLNDIHHDNWQIRIMAAETLVRIANPSMLPDLLNVLKNRDNWEMRYIAATLLGEIGDSSCLSSLLSAVKDKDPRVKEAVTHAILQLVDSKSIPALVKATSDRSDYVRDLAITALGNTGDVQAVPILLHLIKDVNGPFNKYDVKNVGEALAKVADVSSLPALLSMFQSTNVYVRRAVAKALFKVADAPIFNKLIHALQDIDESIRNTAAEALGTLGDTSVIPALLAIVNDKDRNVRSTVAKALGMLGDTSVISTLLAMVNDRDSNVRSAVVQALGTLGDASVIPALLAMVNDKDRNVRIEAAQILSMLGDMNAFYTIIDMLLLDNEYTRDAAIIALGRFKNPQTIGSLVNLLDHPFGAVVNAVRQALELMNIPESRAALAEYDVKHKG